MKVGKKATGQESYTKMCVAHHTSRMRRGKGRRIEKAIETRVRQSGKKACSEQD